MRNAIVRFRKNPITVFVLFLIFLFVVIFLVSSAAEPEITTQEKGVKKDVIVFDIGEKPTIIAQGKVVESGAVQIFSQTGGIASKIHVKEGDKVYRGSRLLSIANNYEGGNAASIQASVAAKQLKNLEDTFDTQKDLINLQRDIANQVEENSQELRNLAGDSISGTEKLLDQNKDILETLEDNLTLLEQSNTDGSLDEEIFGIKQGIALQSAQILQIESGLRSSSYQASDENPPADLARLQKDVTLKQIDLQESALYLGRDIARLQAAAAAIGASIFYPSSPVTGVVEAVNVVENQVIAPGTPLATLKSSKNSLKIVVQVPKELAPFVSRSQSAKVLVDNNELELFADYVSTISTQANQHTATYTSDTIPQNIDLPQNSFVQVRISLFGNCLDVQTCFVPIESVHQTQESTAVYIVEEGIARLREITIGPIVGKFVEVLSGLENVDKIIISRNVVDGDGLNLQ